MTTIPNPSVGFIAPSCRPAIEEPHAPRLCNAPAGPGAPGKPLTDEAMDSVRIEAWQRPGTWNWEGKGKGEKDFIYL